MAEPSPGELAVADCAPAALEGGCADVGAVFGLPLLGGLPYPGLRPFRPDEIEIFFGRETALDAMADRLSHTKFLAVLGPSGCGKSSLVRTGLYTTLRLGLLPNSGGRWKIAELTPGRQPTRNLARALALARSDDPHAVDPDPENVGVIADHLKRGPRSVVELAECGMLDNGWNLLLVVDQFEELFRFGDYAGREEAEAFVALLLESARSALPIHIVITMRSEYLGACSLIPGLAEQISDGMFLTPRMTRDECREAIEGPARVRGFDIEPELVARILNDLQVFAPFERHEGLDQADQLALQADQLPLMQHMLNRIWRRATTGRDGEDERLVLTMDDYDGVGGLTGALDTHGEEILAALAAELGADVAATTERVFRALVDGPSLPLAVRRPRTLGDLVEAAGGDDKRDEVKAIVEAFRGQDCNFLRTSEPALDDTVIVDLGHESLIRRWSCLKAWFAAEVKAREMWDRLSHDALLWEQDKIEPLRELALRRFTEWWSQEQPTPYLATRHGGNFDTVRRFLEASGAAEDRRRKRTKRIRYSLRIGALVLIATLLVLVKYFIVLKERADAQAKNAREQSQIAQKQSQIAQNANALYASAATEISRNTFDAMAIRKYFSNRHCGGAPEFSAAYNECVDAVILLIQRNYFNARASQSNGQLPSAGNGPAGGVINDGLQAKN